MNRLYLHALSSLPALYETWEPLPYSSVSKLKWSYAAVSEGSREDLQLRRLGVYSRPVHLLVRDASSRPRRSFVIAHLCSNDLPYGSFVSLSDEIYASSPEFAFMQMAKELDVINTIRLGYELCSGYRINKDYVTGFEEHSPLTTAKRVNSYLARAGGLAGVDLARKAVKHIIDGSRSPRETALSMMLSLPTRLGGWQFGKHVLNKEIEIDLGGSGHARRYVDLYWPEARVGLEYDSDTFHVGKERITHDSVREKVLERAGIRMLRITNDELYDPQKRELAFQVLAKLLGIRLRNDSYEIRKRRNELASRLLKQKALF